MFQTVLLCAVLIIAVIIDLWKCKIPNWLCAFLYVSEMAYIICTDNFWYFYLLDSIFILMILYPFFLIGVFGAGDIKLLTGISLCFGLEKSINLIIIAIVIGAIFSIAKIFYLFYKKEYFQFSNLYIHFSLPIAISTVISFFSGGFFVWQIF